MEHVMFVGQISLSIDDIIKQNYEMILFKQLFYHFQIHNSNF